MAFNPNMTHPQSSSPYYTTSPANYTTSSLQPRGSRAPPSSGDERKIRGGPGGNAEGPVAIGGPGGDVDFPEAPLPPASAPHPGEHKQIAIGGTGGRVRVPYSLAVVSDIEGGTGGKAKVTEVVRNR